MRRPTPGDGGVEPSLEVLVIAVNLHPLVVEPIVTPLIIHELKAGCRPVTPRCEISDYSILKKLLPKTLQTT